MKKIRKSYKKNAEMKEGLNFIIYYLFSCIIICYLFPALTCILLIGLFMIKYKVSTLTPLRLAC